MGIAGDETVAVVDLDHITILGVEVRKDDDPAGSGVYRGAHLRHEVDTFMESALPCERIDAPAVARRAPFSTHRRHRWHQLFTRVVEGEKRFECRQLVPAILHLAAERFELLLELRQRKVLGWFGRRKRAALTRRLPEHEVLGPESGKLREPLAE